MEKTVAKMGAVCIICIALLLGRETAMAQSDIPYDIIEGGYIEKREELPGVKLTSFITTADTAVAIANAILCDGKTKGVLNDLLISAVIYDPSSEVWIVEYASVELMLGGNISIALSEKTGQVLYMEAGE